MKDIGESELGQEILDIADSTEDIDIGDITKVSRKAKDMIKQGVQELEKHKAAEPFTILPKKANSNIEQAIRTTNVTLKNIAIANKNQAAADIAAQSGIVK